MVLREQATDPAGRVTVPCRYRRSGNRSVRAWWGVVAVLIVMSALSEVRAGEGELMGLAREFYSRNEYYHAITEIMRYQHLYPKGTYLPESMLLLGKSYYRGDNYGLALQALSTCYGSYRNLPPGEEALYIMGSMRLLGGSPFYAIKTFQEYRYVYRDGKYGEDAAFRTVYAYALAADLNLAMEEVARYRAQYPRGRFVAQAAGLEREIDEEMNRPTKSVLLSALGSLVLPGFGHFYTGNYRTGTLSLLSNALLIFLAWDGYRDGNRSQMVFFGAMEFIFYQYSLAGGINSVHEYNSRENFYRKVRLGITVDF